jgi:hypothetical protein
VRPRQCYYLLLASLVLALSSSVHEVPALGRKTVPRSAYTMEPKPQTKEILGKPENQELGGTSSREEESTATLEETLGWIEGKMRQIGAVWTRLSPDDPSSSNVRTSFTERLDRFDKCVVYWTSERVDLWDLPDVPFNNLKGYYDEAHHITQAIIPLNSIDPLSLKISGNNKASPAYYSLSFEVSATSNPLEVTVRDFSMRGNSRETAKKIENKVEKDKDTSHSWEIIFRDKDLATRVSRALRHASKLCGSKVDPF